MESSYHVTALDSHDTASSRPTIGFPLGMALLLLVIFSLSGVFSCCYHWDKLRRSLSTRAADFEANGDLSHSNSKTKDPNMVPQVILMPGDNVPKFVAMPCPRDPSRRGEIIVEVQKPPLQQPKPLRIAVPLL
ncbi:uncharacterized protein At5g65660-like [Primulina eburnea]|uniref:uncharacterized protein At5g65660-like n=1 Tax=Primulina eburnea TaxID=1245227 RepID=UPI003C6C7936